MSRNQLRPGAVAAAVILVAAACTASPTPSLPAATPTTIASGTFTAPLTGSATTVKVEATRSAGAVSGVMDVTEGGTFSAALACTRTTPGGLLLVGGDVKTSTHDAVAVGVRAALIVKPGSPAKAGLWFEEAPPAASCDAFLAGVPDDASYLQPIDGSLALGG